MRKGVCTGFALVLSVAVAACGGSKGQAGAASRGGAGSTKQYAELRWGDVPFPGVIDLQKSPFGSAELVESLVVQDLVEFEPNGTLKPGLASSIERPNQTTYIYNIRRGVKFSDGHPLTVADVVYSLDQNMSKESSTQTLWADVSSVYARGSSAKYKYDLAAAKRELSKSAYPHGFSTELQVAASELVAKEAAEVIVADLAKIGVSAKIRELQPAEDSNVFGKVKMFMAFNFPWNADPDGNLTWQLPESEIRPSGGNTAGYRNAELNRLLVAERGELNPARRLQLIDKLLTIVGNEVPYMTLWRTPEFASLSNKYVDPHYSAWTNWFTPWAMHVKLAE